MGSTSGVVSDRALGRARTSDRTAPRGVSPSGDALANIAALIDDGGQITIGQLYPIECAAIANDGKYMFQSYHALSFYFDLKNDPREIHNLYASEPERARKLAASYFAFERSCKRYNPDYVGIKLDPKSIEHLKSLGYIQ